MASPFPFQQETILQEVLGTRTVLGVEVAHSTLPILQVLYSFCLLCRGLLQMFRLGLSVQQSLPASPLASYESAEEASPATVEGRTQTLKQAWLN